jgi:hypothetical protein
MVLAARRLSVLVLLGAVSAGAISAGAVSAGSVPADAGAATTSAALAGDATPRLDPATVGQVAIAASSAPNHGRVAVIVRNDTNAPVNNVRIDATATRPDGGAVTSASTSSVVPATLAPGAYGLAVLDFRKQGVAIDSVVAFKVRHTKAASGIDPKLLVVSGLGRSAPTAGKVAQTLTFTVANPTKRAARGPITATIMCFNEAGKPVNLTTARVRPTGLGAGKAASVSVGLAELCPTALVGARSS